MRKTMLSLTALAGLMTVGAFAPGLARAAQAAPLSPAIATVPDDGLVQRVDWDDWRWRRHEEWERHRRWEAYREWRAHEWRERHPYAYYYYGR